MDATLVSALSALGGSVVGGLATGLTTWLSHRSHAKAGQRAFDLAQRHELYKDFITAASTMYGSAMINSEPKIQEVVDLYGTISRMRVVSSPPVVACAERINFLIMDAYFSPNRTMHEMRELIKSGEAIDPLKEFSEVARAELRAR